MRARFGAPVAFVAFIGVLAAAAVMAAQARPAEIMLETARKLEVVDGNYAAAIKQYQQIVDRFSKTDRPSAATALLRMAECQQKLGDTAAQRTYQEIVSRYADQTSAAATARARLDAASTQSAGAFVSRDILKLIDWTPAALAQATLSRISPDGRWLMFSRVNGPQNAAAPDVSVCLRDLRNGAERVLLSNVSGDRPFPFIQWSPDSRRLAVSRLASDATTVRREIMVVDLADTASQPIRFTSIAAPRQGVVPARFPEPLTWSSDGRLLAYVAFIAGGAQEVRVFDVSTGRTRPIAPIQPAFEVTRSVTLPQLRWSPDHTELAVQNGVAGGADEVRLLRVADGHVNVVTLPAEPGQRALMTAWTPRGLVLRREPQAARASNALVPLQILVLDPSTGRASVVCSGALSDNNAGNAANETLSSTDTDVCLGVTSDGQRAMRWSTELQRVVLRDTASGRDTPLTSGVGEERFATLINNDQTVIFLSNADGRWGIYAAPIARAPVATPVLIATLDALPGGAAIKPTTDGFAWSASYGGWNLWRIDTDPVTGRAIADPVRLFTPNAGDSILAAVSPDGRQVAYWSRRGYRTGLAVMDANGANKRIVRETEQPRFHNYGASPVWVSNDELLYADYSRRTDQRKFFTINLRTGANTPIPFPELESAPPDGTRRSWQFVSARREMVYVNRSDPAAAAVFRARPLLGGSDRVLATLDVPVSALGDFLISPDGGRIAYRSRGRWQVYDVATKSLVASAGNFSTPGDWSRDGNYLLTDLDGQPAVSELATGRSWPILSSRLAENWMLDEAGDAAWWAPDRSYVILTLPSGRHESRQWHGVTAEAIAKAVVNVKRP